jgi:hypothetical protein
MFVIAMFNIGIAPILIGSFNVPPIPKYINEGIPTLKLKTSPNM